LTKLEIKSFKLAEIQNRKSLLDASNTGVLKIIGVASTFLLSVFLARTLEPANYGQFSYIVSIIMLLTVPIQFGIPKLLLRFVAEYKEKKEDYKIIELIAQSHIILLIASAILLVIFTFIPFGFENDNFTRWIIFLNVIIYVLNIIYSSILRGFGKVIIGNLSDLVLRPLLFIILILITSFLKMKFDVNSILILYLFSNSTALIYVIWNCKLIILESLKSIKLLGIDWLYIKNLLGLLTPLFLISAVDILNSNIDIIFLGQYVGKNEVGIYKVGLSLSWLFSLPRSIFTIAWAPHIASEYHKSKIRFKILVNRMSKLVFFSSIILFLMVIFFSQKFIFLAYGGSYSDSSIILLILSSGHFLNISLGMGDVVLNMSGHDKDVAKSSFLAVSINLILAFILIPKFGIYGAAISTSVSMGVWNIFLFRSMKRLLSFYPNPFN
jgi:O-antigen/teichoic acid export membrane protein